MNIINFNPDFKDLDIEMGFIEGLKDNDIRSKQKLIIHGKTFVDYKSWSELEEWTKHEAVSLFLEMRPQDIIPESDIEKYTIVYQWVNGWFEGNTHRPRYFINKFKENFPNSWEGV
jgi:hypothetical protein